MAMSSSGLANIVLEDFMEVVPAYRISSDTIYELSSSPELKVEEVEMLAEYAAKPAKRQRQQIVSTKSSLQHLGFSKAPIVPSFGNVLNPGSATQTGYPGVATVLLNKQREDQEAAERLLSKYKSAGMASLPPKVSSLNPNSEMILKSNSSPWGSSNAFNTNKQTTINGVLRANPETKLESNSSSNTFGIDGGDVVKRTVILKNAEKIKEPAPTEAAVDAKTTPHSIVMKPISTLLEETKLKINLAVGSTKTIKRAVYSEAVAANAKTTEKLEVIKPMPTLMENPAQRYGLVAGTIKAILNNPNLRKAFVVQVFWLNQDLGNVTHQLAGIPPKQGLFEKLEVVEPKFALLQILNVRHKGMHFSDGLHLSPQVDPPSKFCWPFLNHHHGKYLSWPLSRTSLGHGYTPSYIMIIVT